VEGAHKPINTTVESIVQFIAKPPKWANWALKEGRRGGVRVKAIGEGSQARANCDYENDLNAASRRREGKRGGRKRENDKRREK